MTAADGREREANPVTNEEFFIPFGNFTGSGDEDGQGPLVGRGVLRSQLIRTLVFGGQKLACLVTGRRGMGKTSFVRYCLKEYQENAFERFRRVSGGKSLIDLAVVTALITLIASACVLIARVSHMFLSDESYAIAQLLGLVLALALAGIFVFATAYAIRSHIRPGQDWPTKVWGGLDIAVAWIFIVLMLYWYRADSKLPLIVSAQFLLLSTTIAWGANRRASAFNSAFVCGSSGRRIPFALTCVQIFLAPGSEVYQGFSDNFLVKMGGEAAKVLQSGKGLAERINDVLAIKSVGFASQDVLAPLVGPLMVAALFAAVQFLIRCLRTVERGRGFRLLRLRKDVSGFEALKLWAPLCGSFGVFLWAAKSFLAAPDFGLKHALFLLVVVGVNSRALFRAKCLTRDLMRTVKDDEAHAKALKRFYRTIWPAEIARAQGVFRAKSVFFLATGMYLFVSTRAIEFTLGLINSLVGSTAVVPKISGDPGDNDLLAIAAIAAIAMLISVIELKVICRPFGAFGAHRDIATCLSGHSGVEDADRLRNPHLDGQIEEWCRRLEQMTLTWQIYKLYVRPIVVHVNLGFDDLRHSSVIHGMLVGLRDEYRRTFLEWNSHLATVLRMTGGIAALSLIAAISSSSFVVIPKHFLAGGILCPAQSGDKKGGSTSNVDDVSVSVGGAIPSFLCHLDSSSKLASIVYMPIVPLQSATTYHANSTLLKWLRGDVEWLRANEPKDFTAASKEAVKAALIEQLEGDDIKKIRDALIKGKAPQVYEFLSGGRLDSNYAPAFIDLGRQVKDWYEGKYTEYGDAKKYQDEAVKTLEKASAAEPLVPPSEMDALKAKVSEASNRLEPLEKARGKLLANAATVTPYVDRLLDAGRFQSYALPAIRVYHVGLLLLLLAGVSWLNGKIPLLPYRRNLREVEALLDSLTGKTVRERSRSMWEPARWVHSMFSQQEKLTVEHAPVDPRAVEAAFITILRDVSVSYWRLPGGRMMRLGIPCAEVTFVFDEMDKLWAKGGIHPSGGGGQRASDAELGGRGDERERALMTSRLLSDLKRVISDSPARFIFVGGRMLHDEWLADMHSGSALLTSIFDCEFYVPSLLTDTTHRDHEKQQKSKLRRLVGAFVRQRHRIATLSQEQSGREATKFWPWFARRDEQKLCFLDNDKRGAMTVKRRERKGKGQRAIETDLPPAWQSRLIRQLEEYLAYRSAGNPKRLQEMLCDLMRPASRVRDTVDGPNLRSDDERTEEILCLNPPAILRIQFVSEVYNHLRGRFEDRLLHRDDKMVLSTFFLTDYLFKFHRRAFGWSNIERIDELTHIHRAPDIREVLLEMVDHFSHRFLLRVVNGMYDLRFRSEVAQELSYISQYSEIEMAAFNFTLDESQGMKASFNAAMSGNGRPSIDLVAGLGELYEYDQEYDAARQNYRRALRLTDEDLYALLSCVGPHGPDAPGVDGMLGRILDDVKVKDHAYPRIPLAWALSRLRLMLQIGMTYEQAGNFERAEGEYVAAHHLARKFLNYYIMFDYGNLVQVGSPSLAPEGEVLKHASLLYQPMFAIAWNSEKLWSDIDTSCTTVEKNLHELRAILPFVQSGPIPISRSPHEVAHSGFALIASDLHNKAADLMFFKGRQFLPYRDLDDYIHKGRAIVEDTSGKLAAAFRGAEGYLLRAHHHYCMALHELRRYVVHRKVSSARKLNFAVSGWPTLAQDDYPFFVHQAAAGIIANLAEGVLSRVSTLSLLVGMPEFRVPMVDDIRAETEQWRETLRGWLGSDVPPHSDEAANEIAAPLLGGSSVFGKLSDWLGGWKEDGEDRLAFGRAHHAELRLLLSLNLNRAGAEFRAIDGHYDDAAKELFMVAQTVCRYLWTFRLLKAVCPKDKLPAGVETGLDSAGLTAYTTYLTQLGLECLTKAYSWLEFARTGESEGKNIAPPEAITLACSLALAIPDAAYDMRTKLQDLVEKWRVPFIKPRKPGDKPDCDKDAMYREKDQRGEATSEYFRTQLLQSLLLRRYPVLNRLNGFKVLVDSLVAEDTTTVCDKIPKEGECRQINVRALLREYMELYDRFNAPHIAPFADIGQTVACYYLRASRSGGGATEKNNWNQVELPPLRNAAKRYIMQSAGSYTLGGEYYAMIGRLYYLYDDFNDRQLHHARATEMSQWDISAVLLASLEATEEVHRKPLVGVVQDLADA